MLLQKCSYKSGLAKVFLQKCSYKSVLAKVLLQKCSYKSVLIKVFLQKCSFKRRKFIFKKQMVKLRNLSSDDITKSSSCYQTALGIPDASRQLPSRSAHCQRQKVAADTFQYFLQCVMKCCEITFKRLRRPEMSSLLQCTNIG